MSREKEPFHGVSESVVFRRLGNVIPDQRRIGAIQGPQWPDLVGHFVVPWPTRHVAHRHLAEGTCDDVTFRRSEIREKKH